MLQAEVSSLKAFSHLDVKAPKVGNGLIELRGGVTGVSIAGGANLLS